MASLESGSHRPVVLVTGANGYIGNAVCRAFVRAGWTVYGLLRNAKLMSTVAEDEIIPILGSPADQSFLPSLLEKQKTFDAIVSTTEQIPGYEAHFEQVLRLLQALSDSSNAAGIRPLVLFTSGCKDYGQSGLADSTNISPHTESSPLNPPQLLEPRTSSGLTILDQETWFDAVVLRPTTVHGRSSSLYGLFFTLAQHAKDHHEPLRLPAHPKTILHSLHIDDCADAYVKIAEAKNRTQVAGQCYNMSGWRYETLEEIAQALVQEYGLEKGVVYSPERDDESKWYRPSVLVTAFSQWVGSDKIREQLGWKDCRPLFTESLHMYRLAYEAAVKHGHDNVRRVQRHEKVGSAAQTLFWLLGLVRAPLVKLGVVKSKL